MAVLAGDTDPAAVCHRVKPEEEEEEEEEDDEEENPLLVPLEEKSVLKERQTSLWFGKVSPSGSEQAGLFPGSALRPLTHGSLSPGRICRH